MNWVHLSEGCQKHRFSRSSGCCNTASITHLRRKWRKKALLIYTRCMCLHLHICLCLQPLTGLEEYACSGATQKKKRRGKLNVKLWRQYHWINFSCFKTNWSATEVSQCLRPHLSSWWARRWMITVTNPGFPHKKQAALMWWHAHNQNLYKSMKLLIFILNILINSTVTPPKTDEQECEPIILVQSIAKQFKSFNNQNLFNLFNWYCRQNKLSCCDLKVDLVLRKCFLEATANDFRIDLCRFYLQMTESETSNSQQLKMHFCKKFFLLFTFPGVQLLWPVGLVLNLYSSRPLIIWLLIQSREVNHDSTVNPQSDFHSERAVGFFECCYATVLTTSKLSHFILFRCS